MKTKLDLILDQVEAKVREVTFDVQGYTPDQIRRVVDTAETRGLDVAGHGRWLLVRDLRGMDNGNPS